MAVTYRVQFRGEATPTHVGDENSYDHALHFASNIVRAFHTVGTVQRVDEDGRVTNLVTLTVPVS